MCLFLNQTLIVYFLSSCFYLLISIWFLTFKRPAKTGNFLLNFFWNSKIKVLFDRFLFKFINVRFRPIPIICRLFHYCCYFCWCLFSRISLFFKTEHKSRFIYTAKFFVKIKIFLKKYTINILVLYSIFLKKTFW